MEPETPYRQLDSERWMDRHPELQELRDEPWKEDEP